MKKLIQSGGTTFGRTLGTIQLIEEIEKFYTITPDTVFLDIGSGDGIVLNDFKNNTVTDNVIGVEMQNRWVKESNKLYPGLEVHEDYVQNRLDLVERSNIIYTNNICIPVHMIFDIWDSVQPGTIFIFNNILAISKFVRNLGYSKTDFYHFKIDANFMNSNFAMVIKK